MMQKWHTRRFHSGLFYLQKYNTVTSDSYILILKYGTCGTFIHILKIQSTIVISDNYSNDRVVLFVTTVE